MRQEEFDDVKQYKTSDLYFAAYLKTAGCRMIDHIQVDYDNGFKVFFVFEKNPLIHKLKVEYFDRTSKVVALDYADNVRSLKSYLFINKNSGYSK